MKRFYRFLLLPLLFVLVACSSTSPKDTFISRLESNQSAKQSAYEFVFKLEEAEMGDAGYNPLAGFVGQDITLYVSQDMEKNLMGVSVDLAAFSPDLFQFEVIYADDKAYMSAAPMLAMSGVSVVDYQGKYIDLEAASGESLPALSSFSPEDYQNVDFYKELESTKFTQKGDDVTLSMSVAEFFELAKKNLAKTDEEAAAAFDKQSEAVMEQLSPESQARITLDKDGNGRAMVKIVTDGDSKSQLTLSMTFKKVAYKAPTVPKESDILSEEALAQVMMSSLGTTTSKMSDSDFEVFYAGLESAVSEYTREELQSMITALKPSLTDEQVARLEALLPKAKDSN